MSENAPTDDAAAREERRPSGKDDGTGRSSHAGEGHGLSARSPVRAIIKKVLRKTAGYLPPGPAEKGIPLPFVNKLMTSRALMGPGAGALAAHLKTGGVLPDKDRPRASTVHIFWRQLLRDGRMPFLKRDIVTGTNWWLINSGWEEEVAKTGYPLELITDYLRRIRAE